MESRAGALPTGVPQQYSNVPQYPSLVEQHSTNSTDSADSFRTQVPLPFYIPHEPHGQAQGYNIMPQLPRPWATPDILQNPTMPPMQGYGTPLNPTTSGYVPSGYAPQNTLGPQGFQNPSPYAAPYGSHDPISSASPMPALLPGTQMSDLAPYQNMYTAQPGMIGGPVGGMPSQFQQQQQYGDPNPYGQFAPAGNYQAVPTMYNPATPAANYAATNTNQNFQAQGYPAGPAVGSLPWGSSLAGPSTHNTQGNGYPQEFGAGANQQWGPGMFHPNMAHNQNIGPATTPYAVPSHDNRYNNGTSTTYEVQDDGASRFSSQQSSSTSLHSTHSSPPTAQATAQALSQNSKGKQPMFEVGGQLLTPKAKSSGSAVRTPSPGKSSGNASSRSMSRNSQMLEKIEEDEPTDDMPPTPGSKPRQLEIEFSSEPRSNETPRLRTRRGQSITSTDPAHKSVTNWLESTPTLENSTPTPRNASDEKRRASPPKMLNLLATGSVSSSNLKTISEDDPFGSGPVTAIGPPPGPPRGADPFAPLQAIVPYNDSLVGPAARNTGMSPQLRSLTDNGTRKPTILEALDSKNLPFAESCRLAKEDTWGVIKIKNIPYTVRREEIIAFLGRNSKILPEDKSEPVHVIMDRVSSKTLDCYVEFVSFSEAVAAVNRFDTNRTGGHGGRLGERHVEVALSSQDQLMNDLFPRATNIEWHGARPRIIPPHPNDQYSSGFQGFLSPEELNMLVKHVESPLRSPFARDCPQRPFECLISTLVKYPWYMVDAITIEDRNALHKATVDVLRCLIDRVNNNRDEKHVSISEKLVNRLWKAALRCPGFTPTMKDDITYISQINDETAIEFGVPPFAAYWQYLWTIGPKPGAPADLLLWYIAIIREATEVTHELSLAEQAALGEPELKLFGDLDKHIELPRNLGRLKLADVAKAEWTAIEKILRHALGPKALPPNEQY